MNIIVPARKGSKGVPQKNRLLLEYTLNTIPLDWHDKTIVSTNDDFIIDHVEREYSTINIHRRSDKSAVDIASTKECLREAINDYSLSGDIVMLYLTSPERTWGDIVRAYSQFVTTCSPSLLCKEEADSHPFVCMYSEEGNKGRQIVTHDLYRRQDYPECFKISHFISIFKVEELKVLNQNLYNEDTYFYEIPKSVDVDTQGDLDLFQN